MVRETKPPGSIVDVLNRRIWVYSTPGRIVLIVVFVLVFLSPFFYSTISYRERASPRGSASVLRGVLTTATAQLPVELKKISCPEKGAGFRAATSDDFIRFAGTTIAVLCMQEGSSRDNRFYGWTKPPLMPGDLSFEKSRQGKFTEPVRHRTRSSESPRYSVEAEVDLKPFVPFRPGPRFRKTVLHTPKAFAATGAGTVFVCSPAGQRGQECVAHFKSTNLHWAMRVRFGQPAPRDSEMRAELVEAYELLAAHVLGQD